MKLDFGVLFYICLLSFCVGQQWNPSIEQDIIGFITNLMDCRLIPGLSVAIAQKDNILMQKGFGYSDTSLGTPATENTKFCIGSCSKAFMATIMGSVLAENNETYPDGWNTRLKDVFGPDFELSDPYRTNVSTIKDTLTHRLGLGQYIGGVIVMVDTTHSRQEYCKRIKYFEATTEFRGEFSYNNWMFMLASCVAEIISGQSFEDLVQERVFDTLGMDNSVLTEDGIIAGDLATAYCLNETSDEIIEMDRELVGVYPAEASGGICGPATDIAKWIQFHLQDSKLPILPTETWTDTMTPQFIQGQGDVSVPTFPVTHDMPNYGLGWEVGTYRGYRQSMHTGSLSGFQSLTTVFHDVDLAIYTCSNGLMYNGDAHSAAHYYIADLVLGLEAWLDNSTACTYPMPWETTSQKEAPTDMSYLNEYGDIDDNSFLDSYAAMADPNSPVIGNYGHPFLGNITVTFDESTGQLRFTAGRFGTGFMVHRPVIEEMYEIHFDGQLGYFSHASPNYGIYPPILFRNLVGNSTHGEYQEIYAIGVEPFAPPTYYRDFQWDDTYPPIL